MSKGVPRGVLTEIGIDSLIEILSKRHRRLILFTLKRGDTLSDSDLLFRGPETPDDAETQLYHTHLPKLAAAGYIDWDRDTGKISKGPKYDEIAPLLTLMEKHADELPPDWP